MSDPVRRESPTIPAAYIAAIQRCSNRYMQSLVLPLCVKEQHPYVNLGELVEILYGETELSLSVNILRIGPKGCSYHLYVVTRRSLLLVRASRRSGANRDLSRMLSTYVSKITTHYTKFLKDSILGQLLVGFTISDSEFGC